jgi:hypothetical protein
LARHFLAAASGNIHDIAVVWRHAMPSFAANKNLSWVGKSFLSSKGVVPKMDNKPNFYACCKLCSKVAVNRCSGYCCMCHFAFADAVKFANFRFANLRFNFDVLGFIFTVPATGCLSHFWLIINFYFFIKLSYSIKYNFLRTFSTCFLLPVLV